MDSFEPFNCVTADRRPVDSSQVSGETDVGLDCVTTKAYIRKKIKVDAAQIPSNWT